MADIGAGGHCCCRHDDGTAADDDNAGDAVPEPHVCAFQPACSVTWAAPQCQGAALNCPHVPTQNKKKNTYCVGAGRVHMDRVHASYGEQGAWVQCKALGMRLRRSE